jgi:hypothetical protein
MSRGHGRIQLQVLEFLLRFEEDAQARGERDAYVPIAAIAGPSPTRSRVESVRRAVKSLAEEGLIVLRSDNGDGSGGPGRRLSPVGTPHGLLARLATAAEASHDARATPPHSISNSSLSA